MQQLRQQFVKQLLSLKGGGGNIPPYPGCESDFIFLPGSGSGWEKFREKQSKTEKCKKIGSVCNFILKIGTFRPAPWIFILAQSFCLFQLQKTFKRYLLSWIRIRKKKIRVHSPIHNLTSPRKTELVSSECMTTTGSRTKPWQVPVPVLIKLAVSLIFWWQVHENSMSG